MYLDAQCLFTGTPPAPAQTITASAVSTNIYDFGAYPGTVTGGFMDPAVGDPLYLFAVVTATFATLTSLDVQVQTATDAAFTSPITLSTKNYLAAALTAGTVLGVAPIAGIIGVKEFIRLNFNVNGSNATTGAIEAGITQTLQAWKSAPDLLGRT